MKAKIYYYVGDYDDTIILEAEDDEELIDKINVELSRRGATYTGCEMIEN